MEPTFSPVQIWYLDMVGAVSVVKTRSLACCAPCLPVSSVIGGNVRFTEIYSYLCDVWQVDFPIYFDMSAMNCESRKWRDFEAALLHNRLVAATTLGLTIGCSSQAAALDIFSMTTTNTGRQKRYSFRAASPHIRPMAVIDFGT